jgi:hypothetical protein
MTDPNAPTRDQMMADLAASDAEIDAGDTIPAETVEAMIEAAIASTEQRLAERRVRKTAPGE